MKLKSLVGALFGAASLALAAPASAAFIATIDGNDCAGEFGDSFPKCAIPAKYDLNKSPVIAKYDVEGGWTINTALFPSITGAEWTFSGPGSSGTWTYTPGPGDPVITFFVAKGGPKFNLFRNDDDPNSDSWVTPTNPANDRPYGLSHLTFYDTGFKVPEPTTLALLGGGLLALGALRRRRVS
jgi:hypothetical protein